MVRIRPGHAWLSAAAVAALLATATSDQLPHRGVSSRSQSTSTGADESQPVVCIKGQFPFRALSAPATAEQGTDGASAALRREIARSAGMPNLPRDGWRRLFATGSTVEFGHGEPPVLDGYVVVHLDDGKWGYEQSGGACIVRPFVNGGVAASWQVDPSAAPPGASSDSLNVLVKDSQCAGGRSPEGRLRDPQVRVQPDAIVVTFFADQLEGFQTCPGHPAVRRTVRLPERLGSRQLLDGATVPALPPCMRLGVYNCDAA